jgi:hypothetical protein
MKFMPLLGLSALVLLQLAGCSTTSLKSQDRGRMEAAREASIDMRGMLEAYYDGPMVLDQSWYLPDDHDGQNQGTQALAEKFARALVWQQPFVIGTVGSSVVAGYGNCRSDCYQQQLQRLFGPVLLAGGVKLEVRNTGQGGDCGDSFDNQVWCLPMLVGTDVDVTHYSWTYYEAGRHDDFIPAHEMFYRWSLMLEHSPVPQLIYANGCEKFSTRDQALLEAYAPFGSDVLCMKKGLDKIGYESGKWGEIGDGLHDTNRDGELADVSDQRRNSLGVVYRNWHPGPLLFQTTADALAWRYSAALLLALDWIDEEENPRQRWPEKPVQLAFEELPHPLECPEPWCTTPTIPVCINFEQPTFGTSEINLVNPEQSGWTWTPGREIQKYVPKDEINLPQCLHPNRCSGWGVETGQQADWLTFTLSSLDVGLVAVCCGKKSCGSDMLEAGVEFKLNGKKPDVEAEVFGRSKCVQVQPRFPQSGVPADQRTVTLEIRVPAREKPLPPITHVFGL